MDNRLYFVLGDLLSNLIVGALVAWACWLLFDNSWNMFLAMIIAMAFGMILSMLLWVPAGILFGAMEVMVPLMLTGMVSSMIVGMWAAMHPIQLSVALACGTISGLASINVVWILNNHLRGAR